MSSLAKLEGPATEDDQSGASSYTAGRQEQASVYVRRYAEGLALKLRTQPKRGQEATSPVEDGQARLTAGADTPQVLTFPKVDHEQNKRRMAVRVPLQAWEGHVLSIGSDSFTAILRNITEGRPYEDEEADFSLEEVSPEERSLLKPGAIFRWLIEYRTVGGSRETISKILFRRLPQWTEADIQQAKVRAAEKASRIRWD
jgi:hypothetical protein